MTTFVRQSSECACFPKF